jgi:tRNA threonylcarbamoyladenosine biosynthesis protein TsaB
VITLALDTCLATCSLAILDGDRLIASQSESMTRGHQERLAPMVRDSMTEAGLAFDALGRVGVTVGPGSFTGLRVGLAFAKGLALALKIPCVGVGTLEALAASAKSEGVRVAVIDAGRGNIYLQIFDRAGMVTMPDILPLASAGARLADRSDLGAYTLIGPGATLLADAMPEARCISFSAPAPEAVALLAARAIVEAPRPLYLRPPDARPKAMQTSAP